MRCLNCGYDGLSTDAIHCPNCNVHLSSIMRDCLTPGTLLHNTYRIEYPLGRGGFGITYFAHDTSLNRPVAIKEFYPQEHAIRENKTGRLVIPRTKQETYQRSLNRFLQEGATLAKLSKQKSSGLVDVYTSFQGRDTAYLVMEFVEGITLKDKLNRQSENSLSIDQVRLIMSSLVEALSIAHRQQIYHLDIAPDNIMVTPSGRVVLIDFGAARQGLGTSTTQAYKEAYAPIEVVNGEGFGAWSDVFELGMLLHEMLTGSLPPRSLSRLMKGGDVWTPNLPQPWQELVINALRLYPQDRPKSIDEWWKIYQPIHQPVYQPFHGSHHYSSGQKPLQPDPPVITEMREKAYPGDEQTQKHSILKPAGFALRSMAYVIDFTLLICASVLFHEIQGIPADDPGGYFNGLMVIYVFFALVYAPVMDSSPTQGTLGKMMVGIAVTDLKGRKIQLGHAYNRHFCKIFSYLIFCIGFFMAGFTDNKQTLHDRVAKCLVIKRVEHGYTAS